MVAIKTHLLAIAAFIGSQLMAHAQGCIVRWHTENAQQVLVAQLSATLGSGLVNLFNVEISGTLIRKYGLFRHKKHATAIRVSSSTSIDSSTSTIRFDIGSTAGELINSDPGVSPVFQLYTGRQTVQCQSIRN